MLCYIILYYVMLCYVMLCYDAFNISLIDGYIGKIYMRKSLTDRSQLMVVGSILHGGPIELFLVPVSAPRLV